jgi:CRISPR-associated protein Cas1
MSALLYLAEPKTNVCLSGHALAVGRENADIRPEDLCPESLEQPAERRFPLDSDDLEALALLGGVHITANALHECLDRGIAVAWLSRGGRMRGRAVPALPRCADLRLAQYRECTHRGHALCRARRLVSAKMASAATLLKSVNDNHPSPELRSAIASLREGIERAGGAADLDCLRGHEGAGARAYFAGLRLAFRGAIRFQGRNRRPPTDPANALLSLGYVLLSIRIASLLEARGLDPALGFFHEIHPGRDSLALDLLEEFRHPVVDRTILRLCNLGTLAPEHFEPDTERPGGVRLTRKGQKIFFPAWEASLRTPIRELGASDPIAPVDLLVRQIDALAMSLRRGDPDAYNPFQAFD